MLAIKFLRDVVHDDVVPILTTETMIAVCREHLHLVTGDAHDRNVEGAATEIEDENSLVFVELIQSVSHRGGGRLIDDLKNIKPGELTSRDCRGPFGVVEIRWHRDDCVRHVFAKKLLRIVLELLHDER